MEGRGLIGIRSSILDPRSSMHRAGFTLLEVTLAMALSVVLLTALYMTLHLQYSHARAGRELTDQAAVFRSVVGRITDDINGQLSPTNPILYAQMNGTTILGDPFGGNSSAAAATSSTPTTSSQNSSSQNNSSQNSSSQSNSSQSNSSQNSSSQNSSSQQNSSGQSSQATTTPNTVVFNLGVYGQEDRLVLTGSWLPKDLTRIQEGQTMTSDLRRVVYWLVKDGKKTGLARQELTAVTGQDAAALPPDVGDPSSFIIAPEVKKFTVEYFDGTTWQSSWDGTTLDVNSSLPMGPPALIAINITIVTPAHRAGEKDRETNFRHVVAIPTANITVTTSP
jgi:prepilin-type N-terminal cleavage/methylation domain-containing protein